MEKSLDELIEHLLREIAVCGPAGATVSDFTEFVGSFYNNARNQNATDHQISPPQVVDDVFICAVWRWLSRQPDIRVGKENEHRETPLHTLLKPGSSIADQSTSLPRLFVGNDRIYQAICGHEPDEKRVFRSEYGLLVHIAAARSEGILQGDLGRLAGQDKRSVPKRTDSLHAKGYIIKETVLIRGGHKSSRLTLRRFATAAQVANAISSGTNHPGHTQERTVRDLVNDVIAIFKSKALVEIEDLAGFTGVSTETGQKALVKILRPLVRAGFLKKIKAAVGTSAHTGEPKSCFQRLREFKHTDLDGFAEGSNPLDKAISDVIVDQESQSPVPTIEESDHTTAQWNPDRNIVNVLHHAVSLAGLRGLTNNDARVHVTGLNIKRPLESQLVRQSLTGRTTQPDHLRHLSIVRANKGAAASPEYVHYSLAAIDEMARKSEFGLSSVPGIHDIERDHLADSVESTKPALDKFGFPRLADGLLLQDGAASLTACARSAAAVDLGIEESSDDEETPRRRRRGLVTASKPASTPPRPPPAIRTPDDSDATGTRKKYARRNRPRDQDDTVIGRPRKFAKGTEKFWQHHFWHARLDAEGLDAKRAGTMSHPVGKALFDGRPQRFDEVLVKAKEAGLPLPQSRLDISEDWVQKTLHILQRKNAGVYITPRGMHMSRVLYKSQILILKSNKLRTLDFREQPKVYGYRFLSSSVAHSFQNWRWFPSAYVPPTMGKKHAARKLAVEYPSEFLEAFRQLPRAGVFYEYASVDAASKPQAAPYPKMTAEEYRALMDETDVDSEAERLSTPIYQGINETVTNPAQDEEVDSPGNSVSKDLITASRLGDHSHSAHVVTLQAPTFNTSEQKINPAEMHDPGQQMASHRSPMSLETATGTARSGRLSSPSQSMRPLRRRRPTQKAAEWTDVDHTTSVGSPSAADFAIESNDEDGHGKENDKITASEKQQARRSGELDHAGLLLPIETNASADIFSHARTVQEVSENVIGSHPFHNTATIGSKAEIGARAHDDKSTFNYESTQVPLAWKPSNQSMAGFLDMDLVGQDATLKRKRSISEVLDSREEAPNKTTKQPPRTQAAVCKTIILELLRVNDNVGPGNPSVMRRATGTLWRAQGFSDLPNLTTVKRAIENLVASGQLKQHTFSFREQGGLMVSRSILYPPTVQLADTRIEQLKEALVAAGLADYFPRTWTDAGITATKPKRSRAASQDENSMPSTPEHGSRSIPSREKHHPPTKRTTSESGTPVQDSISPSSRLQRHSRRRPSRSSDVDAKGTSPGRSRASSNSSSSAIRSNAESPHVSFLTLRIPRLGSVPQVRAYNENFKSPNHLRLMLKPSVQRPKHQQKRRPRNSKEDPLHKVSWRKPELPSSLDDVLNEQLKSEQQGPHGPTSSDAERFFGEVALVERWEVRLMDDLLNAQVTWTFINHKATVVSPTSELVSSWSMLRPISEGKFIESPLLDFPSWLPFSQIREKLGLSAGLDSVTSTPGSAARVTRQATGSLRQKRRFNFDDVDLDGPSKRIRVDSDEAFGSGQNTPRGKRTYIRKPKKANPVESQHAVVLSNTSNDDILRIGMSILIVSTLVGGPQRNINWSIVNDLHPQMSQKGLKARWKAIEYLYAEELDRLAPVLRAEYLDAVRNWSVPMANFSEPADSEWEEILDWALATLPSFVSENVLPAFRTELEHLYSLSYEVLPNVRPMLAPHANLRTYEREQLTSSVPFSQAMAPCPSSGLVDQAHAIILSALLSQTFDNAVRAKVTGLLSSTSQDLNMAETATATALSNLLSDRLIAKADSNLKRIPALIENNSLAYTLTSKLSDVLDNIRPGLIVTHDLLCEAIAYKLDVLDEAFISGNIVSIPNQSRLSNGQSLALFNLLHQDMISIHPGAGSKKSRYGVSWEKVGYMTRHIEQAELGFEIVVRASQRYRFGQLLPEKAPRLPPPTKGGMGEWPMWATLPEGEVDQELWHKVLAATIGIVNLRPGVPVREIREMMGGMLTEWEIATILEWAERSAFVKSSAYGDGWRTRQYWWWCCCV